MESCNYCGRNRVGKEPILHKTGCPQVIRRNLPLYLNGWDDGKLGRPESSNNPAYKMGYGNGICAAEEAENGWNPY
ncbi:MAG: hypothetical protein Q7R88_00365 [bacterium]|nr:hypothetical protein [bacterium]